MEDRSPIKLILVGVSSCMYASHYISGNYIVNCTYFLEDRGDNTKGT